MTPRTGTLIAAAVLAFATPLAADERPPAPDGFAWKTIESVKAAFLVPDGWFFKEEKAEGLRTAFFITQESLEKSGQFTTGLTVNVQTLRKDSAQDRAAQFIAGMAATHQVQDTWTTETGVLKGFGCRVRKADEGEAPLVMQVLAIGNSRTNTLTILIFESPEKGWAEAWKKGEVILKHFVLDDEV